MEQEKIKIENKDVKVIRTYSTDMAEAVRQNEASVIKIALAEKEKREREKIYKQAEGTKTSKIFFALGGVLLIIVTIFGISLLFKKNENNTPVVKTFDSLISTDSNLLVDITNINTTEELLKKINPDNQKNTGLIRGIFLTKSINETSQNLTTNDFISNFKINAPNALVRSLSEKYFFGQYFKKTETRNEFENFFIFQTTDYNLAYASLLVWENTMAKDLSLFLNPKDINPEVPEKKWQDIFINNRDARVLYKENGQAVMYYIFINNNIVIANNIDILKEIITRLLIKNS